MFKSKTKEEGTNLWIIEIQFTIVKELIFAELKLNVPFNHMRCHLTFDSYGPCHVKLTACSEKGSSQTGDSLKFLGQAQGKSTVIESKGFTIIQSANTRLTRSAVLYE